MSTRCSGEGVLAGDCKLGVDKRWDCEEVIKDKLLMVYQVYRRKEH